MTDCRFCRIAAGEEPASFVYADAVVVAFMDIHPVTPGHLLVVPRRHATHATDLDDRSAEAVWRAGLRLGAALRSSGLRSEGMNFFVADGEAAGQDVFHFHLHVLPRFAGDGFGLRFPAGYPRLAERAELDRVAAKIRGALGSERST